MNNFEDYVNELSKLTQVNIQAPEKLEVLRKAFDNDWDIDIALELIEVCWIRQWEDYDNDCTMDMVMESFERAYGVPSRI